MEKPGSYPLRTPLTLRGAIATSGGLSFPADTYRIRIHRLNATGEPLDVDYEAILAGAAPDIFIQDGDVIEVPASPAKLMPYAFYRAVIDVVRFGAGIRVAP
jgi:protein involved in polysaccharide export with SLBB domain